MPSSTGRSDTASPTIRLGDRLGQSSRFKTLFAEGMALVEEAAAYLDGNGRAEAKALPAAIAAACSAESMRLTTRLMQVASWLLIRRAVTDGEMSGSEGRSQRVKVTLSAQHRVSSSTMFAQLPEQLRVLTERSLQVQKRVLQLDRMVNADAEALAPPNEALERQFERLRAAYPD